MGFRLCRAKVEIEMSQQIQFSKPAFLLIMLLTILQSCLLQKPKTVEIPANFDWEGHRGCRGLRPENTIPAFVHALEIAEVTTLEMDVVISKDKQIVVSHEAYFNPEITTKPNGDSLSKSEHSFSTLS